MKKLILLFVCLLIGMASTFATTISGAFNLCVGQITTYSASASGGTWVSTSPSVATISSTGVVSAISVGSTMISYLHPGGPGAVIVTVSATPAGPVTGTFSVCTGSTTVLSSSPGGGTWSSSHPAIATVSGGTVYGVTAGLAAISYLGPGSGCPSTAVVTVNTCCSPTGPPPASVATSSVFSACAATAITLNDVGAVIGGATYQWQSSPDSLSWTNIPGAITVPYTHTGMSATTYYRCRVTCTGSGLSTPSSGVKVNYYYCCSGTPVGGTTVASTSYCSACSLSLSLSGTTSGAYITYQWESSSFAGTGAWTNIAGATNDNYTYSPVGALYYRCKVLCTSSALFSYSSTAYVGYPYQIMIDSAAVPSSSCSPNFYTQVNGPAGNLNLRSQYGDGTHDSVGLSVFSPVTSDIIVAHNYAYTGNYSVKRVLYFGDTPQDSVSYTYYYQDCHVFPIGIFFDNDSDCIKDALDPWNFSPVSVKVDSNGVTIDTISATSGLYYKAYGPSGTVYAFSFLPGGTIASCPPSGIIYDTLTGSTVSYPVKTFAVTGNPVSISDLTLVTVWRTGRHVQLGRIYVLNNHYPPSDARIEYTYSPRFNHGPHVSTTPWPASVAGNKMVWNVTDVSAATPVKSVYLDVEAGVYLTPGDTVHGGAVVSSTSGGELDTSNNVVIRVDTVKSGWDPNYIELTPTGCFDTDSSLHLQYTVHFENMGNDTAHNIYVLDTLSDYLDVKSLEIVMASHQMNVATYKIPGGQNVVKFDFPNIKLLDSSYHGLCDGAVIYTINSKPGIPFGESIKARAGIYFDINEVVMTNTSEKQKGCPPPLGVLGQSRSKPILYPNPVSDELVVKADQNLFNLFTVTNSIGQDIIQKQITSAQTRVNVKALPPGIYYVVFSGSQGREAVKFVKE